MENKYQEFGVRWHGFNRRDELVLKEKIFKTAKARDKFVEKIEDKDSGFVEIVSWLN